VANEKTTFADAFKMADQVLYSGVACITDLMIKEGLINLDFADVRAVMRGMGKAMMGTGEASGEDRARHAAEAAIANPLLDDVSMLSWVSPCGRGGDRHPAVRRCLDEGRPRVAHLRLRGSGSHAPRGRWAREPGPRGSRGGRPLHSRGPFRYLPRRYDPGL